ncbi:MAG: hypothetical protein NTY47_04630, partial [Candidatus Omnitrophica bacterium]|nr:hypothetical protein [Candidatus Omnitrophota bacterium]
MKLAGSEGVDVWLLESLTRIFVRVGTAELIISKDSLNPLGRGCAFLHRFEAACQGNKEWLQTILDHVSDSHLTTFNYPLVEITPAGDVTVCSIHNPNPVLIASTLDELDPLSTKDVLSLFPQMPPVSNTGESRVGSAQVLLSVSALGAQTCLPSWMNGLIFMLAIGYGIYLISAAVNIIRSPDVSAQWRMVKRVIPDLVGDGYILDTYRRLTSEETFSLIEYAQNGNSAAMQVLVRFNMPLIISACKQKIEWLQRVASTIELDDLIAVAVTGIFGTREDEPSEQPHGGFMQAVMHFDFSRKTQFSTMFVKCIHHVLYNYRKWLYRHSSLREISVVSIHDKLSPHTELTLEDGIADQFDRVGRWNNLEDMRGRIADFFTAHPTISSRNQDIWFLARAGKKQHEIMAILAQQGIIVTRARVGQILGGINKKLEVWNNQVLLSVTGLGLGAQANIPLWLIGLFAMLGLAVGIISKVASKPDYSAPSDDEVFDWAIIDHIHDLRLRFYTVSQQRMAARESGKPLAELEASHQRLIDELSALIIEFPGNIPAKQTFRHDALEHLVRALTLIKQGNITAGLGSLQGASNDMEEELDLLRQKPKQTPARSIIGKGRFGQDVPTVASTDYGITSKRYSNWVLRASRYAKIHGVLYRKYVDVAFQDLGELLRSHEHIDKSYNSELIRLYYGGKGKICIESGAVYLEERFVETPWEAEADHKEEVRLDGAVVFLHGQPVPIRDGQQFNIESHFDRLNRIVQLIGSQLQFEVEEKSRIIFELSVLANEKAVRGGMGFVRDPAKVWARKSIQEAIELLMIDEPFRASRSIYRLQEACSLLMTRLDTILGIRLALERKFASARKTAEDYAKKDADIISTVMRSLNKIYGESILDDTLNQDPDNFETHSLVRARMRIASNLIIHVNTAGAIYLLLALLERSYEIENKAGWRKAIDAGDSEKAMLEKMMHYFTCLQQSTPESDEYTQALKMILSAIWRFKRAFSLVLIGLPEAEAIQLADFIRQERELAEKASPRAFDPDEYMQETNQMVRQAEVVLIGLAQNNDELEIRIMNTVEYAISVLQHQNKPVNPNQIRSAKQVLKALFRRGIALPEEISIPLDQAVELLQEADERNTAFAQENREREQALKGFGLFHDQIRRLVKTASFQSKDLRARLAGEYTAAVDELALIKDCILPTQPQAPQPIRVPASRNGKSGSSQVLLSVTALVGTQAYMPAWMNGLFVGLVIGYCIYRMLAVSSGYKKSLPNINAEFGQKLTEQDRIFLEDLDTTQSIITHAIAGRARSLISSAGTVFTKVYKIQGAHLVEKCMRAGVPLSNFAEQLKLVRDRMTGLAAKIYISKRERLIQEYVDVLAPREDPERGVLWRVSEETGESLINEYLRLMYKIWQRGVFDRDFSVFNTGRNLSGRIVTFDFDKITFDYPQEDIFNPVNDLIGVLRRGNVAMPSCLSSYYEDRAEGAIEDITGLFFFGTPQENYYWNTDKVEVRQLPLPHPYPLPVSALGAQSYMPAWMNGLIIALVVGYILYKIVAVGSTQTSLAQSIIYINPAKPRYPNGYWTEERIREILCGELPAGVTDPGNANQWKCAGYGYLVTKVSDPYGWKKGCEKYGVLPVAAQETAQQLREKSKQVIDGQVASALKEAPQQGDLRRYQDWLKAGEPYSSNARHARNRLGWRKALAMAGYEPLQITKPPWEKKYEDWRIVSRIVPDIVLPGTRQVVSRPRFTNPQETASLAQEVQRGNSAARETLILAHMGLVKWYVVKQVRTYYLDLESHVDDLIQCGMFGSASSQSKGPSGLARGVELFEPARGCAFSTYVMYWVEMVVDKALRRIRKEQHESLNEPQDARSAAVKKDDIRKADEDLFALIIRAVSFEKLERILTLVEKNPRNRDMFLRFYRYEEAAPDIRARYSVSKSNFYRILKTMRDKIAPHYDFAAPEKGKNSSAQVLLSVPALIGTQAFMPSWLVLIIVMVFLSIRYRGFIWSILSGGMAMMQSAEVVRYARDTGLTLLSWDMVAERSWPPNPEDIVRKLAECTEAEGFEAMKDYIRSLVNSFNKFKLVMDVLIGKSNDRQMAPIINKFIRAAFQLGSEEFDERFAEESVQLVIGFSVFITLIFNYEWFDQKVLSEEVQALTGFNHRQKGLLIYMLGKILHQKMEEQYQTAKFLSPMVSLRSRLRIVLLCCWCELEVMGNPAYRYYLEQIKGEPVFRQSIEATDRLLGEANLMLEHCKYPDERQAVIRSQLDNYASQRNRVYADRPMIIQERRVSLKRDIYAEMFGSIQEKIQKEDKFTHLLVVHRKVSRKGNSPLWQHSVYETSINDDAAALQAISWQDGSERLTVDLRELASQHNIKTLDVLAELHNTFIITPKAPLRLCAGELKKAWGSEWPFTMVEERFESQASDESGLLKADLSGVLSLYPQACGAVPNQNLALLKILRPGNKPVEHDLYIEVHWEKEELYVVTAIDEIAWKDGEGEILCGLNPEKIREYREKYGAQWEKYYKKDFLAACMAFRRKIYNKYTAKGLAASQEEENNLRNMVKEFVGARKVRLGDVLVFPKGTVHSLAHGIEVVEVLTPHYERGILLPTPKRVTSFNGQWFIQKAFDAMIMSEYQEPEISVERSSDSPSCNEILAKFPLAGGLSLNTTRVTLNPKNAAMYSTSDTEANSRSYQLIIPLNNRIKVSDHFGAWEKVVPQKEAMLIPVQIKVFKVRGIDGAAVSYLIIDAQAAKQAEKENVNLAQFCVFGLGLPLGVIVCIVVALILVMAVRYVLKSGILEKTSKYLDANPIKLAAIAAVINAIGCVVVKIAQPYTHPLQLTFWVYFVDLLWLFIVFVPLLGSYKLPGAKLSNVLQKACSVFKVAKFWHKSYMFA